MIAWWWLIPAFYAGVTFGIFLIALLQANKTTPHARHNAPRSASNPRSAE